MVLLCLSTQGALYNIPHSHLFIQANFPMLFCLSAFKLILTHLHTLVCTLEKPGIDPPTRSVDDLLSHSYWWWSHSLYITESSSFNQQHLAAAHHVHFYVRRSVLFSFYRTTKPRTNDRFHDCHETLYRTLKLVTYAWWTHTHSTFVFIT